MKTKPKKDRHTKKLTYCRLSPEQRKEIKGMADADSRSLASMLGKLIAIGLDVMKAPPSLEKNVYVNGRKA